MAVHGSTRVGISTFDLNLVNALLSVSASNATFNQNAEFRMINPLWPSDALRRRQHVV